MQRKFEIDVVSLKNTDCTPFSNIIYLLKDDPENIIIEKPDNHRCVIVPSYQISNYIHFDEITTDWIKLFNGDFVKIVNGITYHFTKISPELRYEDIRINILIHKDEIIQFNEITEENFKLRILKHTLMITAKLPIYPLWGTFNSRYGINYDIRDLYMEINNKLYRFPYGNVDAIESYICMGSNRRTFISPIDAYVNIVNSIFNRDYNFNIKAAQFRNKFKAFVNPIINMDQIKTKLENDEEINLIDALYYLSNSTDMWEKLFIPLPKHPCELEKIDD